MTIKTLFLLLLTNYLTDSYAQELNSQKVITLVNTLSNKLNESYPLPKISSQYVKMLKKNSRKYSFITNRDTLASHLNKDLQEVHKDLHLSINIEAETVQNLETTESDDLRLNNYGFKSVELDNSTSTGYISIPYGFECTQEAFEMAARAMNMAAYSKYVIIDIRGNGGGAGGMGHFLASYFFNPGEEIFYLNGFEKTKSNLQEYTYGYVPGKRLTNAKLYILIDKNTASASEGFAFAMQKLGKATIVGEKSAGAGIAVIQVSIGEKFDVSLPVKMLIAPNTNEGWEGTGVLPDIIAGKEDAWIVAQKDILRKQIVTSTGDTHEILQWKLDNYDIEKTISDYKFNTDEYKELPQTYSDIYAIEYLQDAYNWVVKEKSKDVARYIMKPLRKDVFIIEGLNDIYGKYSSRLYINRGVKNEIISLTRKTRVYNKMYTKDIVIEK